MILTAAEAVDLITDMIDRRHSAMLTTTTPVDLQREIKALEMAIGALRVSPQSSYKETTSSYGYGTTRT